MKNIHILPTDKPSRLVKLKMFGKDKYHLCKDILPIQDEEQYHHLYITFDEEIKEGDYVYDIFKNACPVIRQLKTEEEVLGVQETEFKIILTTDQDLIKDGVQAISDEFIELFVKNPSCEKVKVLNKVDFFSKINDKLIYKIIIPQEEPKQQTVQQFIDQHGITEQQLIDGYKQGLELIFEATSKITKQETLEEAAEKQWGKLAIINDRAAVIAFKAGAKWQAENKYSEEDMHKAYCAGSDFDMSCLKDEQYYMFKKWFEQFKKK
jgi:hypothetical protein